jgi:hypothetical protein
MLIYHQRKARPTLPTLPTLHRVAEFQTKAHAVDVPAVFIPLPIEGSIVRPSGKLDRVSLPGCPRGVIIVFVVNLMTGRRTV